MGICLEVDVLARLEFELTHYDSAVQCFNHCTIFLVLFSQVDLVKMFMQNILSWKPGEFYLRGINKLRARWMARGKYIIDWNKFIVKLITNQSDFTKTEIVYDPPYIYIQEVNCVNFLCKMPEKL